MPNANSCYKCGEELDTPDEGFVHELCQDCQTDFEDWLSQEIASLSKDVEP